MKWGHKLGSETASRITSQKVLGTFPVVIKGLKSENPAKGNVSTTGSFHLAKLNNFNVTTGLRKGNLRLGRREEIPE